MLYQGVELSFGIAFLFVSFARDSDSNSVWQVSNTLRPNVLIEFGIDSDVRSTQQFGYKSLDCLKGCRSFLLELSSMGQFVNVDGGVDSCFCEPCPLLFLDHILY